MTLSNPDGPAVIVDPFSSGGLYAPAFTAAGVPVVAVSSRPDVLPTYLPSYHPEDFPEIVVYDGDLDPVVRRLRELRPRCILPGADSGVELADQLAAAVTADVANDPRLAGARRHKGQMAAAAQRAGLPVIRQVCTNSAAEVADWIQREGLAHADLVVKPPKSASTDGVTRVRGDWQAAFEAQLGQPNQWGVINEQMLVQEYVTGVEHVIDTFSYQGQHCVTDVCRYGKVDNGQHMAIYDWMEWLPPDDPVTPDLVDYTRRFLDAAGFRYGAAHLEVMLTGDGPRLIELNARPHGGGHPRFCRVATGDSQVDRVVRYFGRQGPVSDSYQLRQPTLVVFLINRVSGVVRNAAVLNDVRDLPSYHTHVVAVRDGDHVEITKDLLNTLSLGFVVLSGPDREQVWADYEEIRRIEAKLVVS